jgi:hypothetical protein
LLSRCRSTTATSCTVWAPTSSKGPTDCCVACSALSICGSTSGSAQRLSRRTSVTNTRQDGDQPNAGTGRNTQPTQTHRGRVAVVCVRAHTEHAHLRSSSAAKEAEADERQRKLLLPSGPRGALRFSFRLYRLGPSSITCGILGFHLVSTLDKKVFPNYLYTHPVWSGKNTGFVYVMPHPGIYILA